MKSVLCVLIAMCVSGPVLAERLDDGQASHRPRGRLASTPYPNILFRPMKQMNMGAHHYRAKVVRKTRETSGGHFYTRRGGFIDLSHLRKTTDWAAWLESQIRQDLAKGKTTLRYRCSEPSLYHLTVDYPEAYTKWSKDKQGAFREALALELGLTVSYCALTWHEILTWYGYSAVPFLSEKQSAFSWEDMYSHAVGIEVARRAMLDRERPYNHAVTVALQDVVEELDPMPYADMVHILEETRGVWWRYGRTLRRNLDIGQSGAVTPWLSDQVDVAEPTLMKAPHLRNVMGIDMSDRVVIEIEPNVKIAPVLLEVAGQVDRVRWRDFPRVMAAIEQEAIEQYGSLACGPVVKNRDEAPVALLNSGMGQPGFESGYGALVEDRR